MQANWTKYALKIDGLSIFTCILPQNKIIICETFHKYDILLKNHIYGMCISATNMELLFTIFCSGTYIYIRKKNLINFNISCNYYLFELYILSFLGKILVAIWIIRIAF